MEKRSRLTRLFIHAERALDEVLLTFEARRSDKVEDRVEGLGVDPRELERLGIEPLHVYGPLACFSALAFEDVLLEFEKGMKVRGVQRVEPVPEVRAQLVDSCPMVKAPEAWELGYVGAGVRVAVVDTGVDYEHPDLRGRVVAKASFTIEPPIDYDTHGTHVAGIVASQSEVYRGVAPKALIVCAKALRAGGRGSLDDVIAAVMWAVEEAGADVVNMSLGIPPLHLVTPYLKIFEKWSRYIVGKVREGVIFVAAAGNYGELGANTVTIPALFPGVIAVAACSKEGAITRYSSRGSEELIRALGEVKPSLTAPGGDLSELDPRRGIISCLSTHLDEASRSALDGLIVDDYHVSLAGTSMAAPHVSGAVAILVEACSKEGYRREERYPLIYAALTRTAVDLGATRYEQGHGLIDVSRAVKFLGKFRAKYPSEVDLRRLPIAYTLVKEAFTRVPRGLGVLVPALPVARGMRALGVEIPLKESFLRAEVAEALGQLLSTVEQAAMASRFGLISEGEFENLVEGARREALRLLEGTSY